MKPNTKKIIVILPINFLITFVLFYLFEENRDCITDFGSRCSNQFLIRCTIQFIIVSVVMFFTMKPQKIDKQ
jgi:hypothetical protein